MNAGRELLSPELQQEVVELRPQHVDEWAISLPNAMEAMRQLAQHGLAILGGDYWLRAGDGFKPAYENWAHRSRHEAEEWSAYVEDSLLMASHALEARREYMAGQPAYLVIVATSESAFERLPDVRPGQPPETQQ